MLQSRKRPCLCFTPIIISNVYFTRKSPPHISFNNRNAPIIPPSDFVPSPRFNINQSSSFRIDPR